MTRRERTLGPLLSFYEETESFVQDYFREQRKTSFVNYVHNCPLLVRYFLALVCVNHDNNPSRKQSLYSIYLMLQKISEKENMPSYSYKQVKYMAAELANVGCLTLR